VARRGREAATGRAEAPVRPTRVLLDPQAVRFPLRILGLGDRDVFNELGAHRAAPRPE
jgi:hypothetical protein